MSSRRRFEVRATREKLPLQASTWKKTRRTPQQRHAEPMLSFNADQCRLLLESTSLGTEAVQVNAAEAPFVLLRRAPWECLDVRASCQVVAQCGPDLWSNISAKSICYGSEQMNATALVTLFRAVLFQRPIARTHHRETALGQSH